jgi:hypothetical protein
MRMVGSSLKIIEFRILEQKTYLKEDIMFQVTDEAANMIKKALDNQDQPYAVRLLLQNG